MPTIINGYPTRRRRRYTPEETLTRAAYLIRHPSILTLRDVAWTLYLLYVAYVTYFTLRSIAFLVFEADGRRRWTEPPEEWGTPPPGWKMGWRLSFWLLRTMVWRRLGAWVYEVFSWGFFGAVFVFFMEEYLKWRRARV